MTVSPTPLETNGDSGALPHVLVAVTCRFLAGAAHRLHDKAAGRGVPLCFVMVYESASSPIGQRKTHRGTLKST